MAKRLLSGLLVVTMLFTMLPATVFAALFDNTPDQNELIFEELKNFWGDDETAKTALELLRTYGLIDDGNVLTDWSGSITITDDFGERATNVTELLTMLESGNYDPATVVTVDGSTITMADFATMMEIEKELKRIKYTYLQDEVTMTTEQLESLYSLYRQMDEKSINLLGLGGTANLVFPSGADHSQRLSVPADITIENGGTAALTVSFAHPVPEGNSVSVNWRIAEGSATGTIGGETSGTLTFGEGEQTKDLTVASSSDERWNGTRAFVVEYSNADGALFESGVKTVSTVVYVTQTSMNIQAAKVCRFTALITLSQIIGIITFFQSDIHFRKIL